MADTLRPVESRGFFDDAITDRVPPHVLELTGAKVDWVGTHTPPAVEHAADTQQARLDAFNEGALRSTAAMPEAAHVYFYSQSGGFHTV